MGYFIAGGVIFMVGVLTGASLVKSTIKELIGDDSPDDDIKDGV